MAAAFEKFPVLLTARVRKAHPEAPKWVPWPLVAPHESRALKNHHQTLARLAERGGLCPVELLAVLDNRAFPRAEYVAKPDEITKAAVGEILKRAARWERAAKNPPTVEGTPALMWTCEFCACPNSTEGVGGLAECSFCRMLYILRCPVPNQGPDATPERGATDDTHANAGTADGTASPPDHAG
jgi:hypothetical protein